MLISLMKQNPHLAIGIGNLGINKQRLAKKLWEDFSVKLNNLGPPHRTTKQWQRVWIHFKGNLKRRLFTNKKKAANDQCPEIKLPPLLQSVVSLIELKQAAFDTSKTMFSKSDQQSKQNKSLSDRKLRARKSNTEKQFKKSSNSDLEASLISLSSRQNPTASTTNMLFNIKEPTAKQNEDKSHPDPTRGFKITQICLPKLQQPITEVHQTSSLYLEHLSRTDATNEHKTLQTNLPATQNHRTETSQNNSHYHQQPVTDSKSVESEILQAITQQLEGQSKIIDLLQRIDSTSQNNCEMNRKVLSIMEKQYADSKELHELNVRLAKEKIKKLELQNKSNNH